MTLNGRAITGAVVLLLLAGALASCDREDGREPPAAHNTTQSASPNGATAQANLPAPTGTIRGKIKFSGTAPPAKPVQRECHPGMKVNIPDESYVVGPGGELRDAVVFLKNPPVGSTAPTPAAPVVDQKDCVYVPHVVAARVGQVVTFTSSDKVLHNVHAVALQNGESNQSMQFGETRTYPLIAAEYVTAKCDVHPWMRCRIAVFDHPFYAVTKDDGSFEFNGLPPGTYTVGVWHDKLGQRTKDVTVAAGKPVETTITVEKK